ncbi:hypothetical protein [Stenotrophomonas sp. NLF4-10]|uniref:hypothetical protein n=1 Tax=Stenotrophomonas sp. NLF4-10 TaxID=2918754 RepID=UPI001EFB7B41|nr:hypothetical protein [Stenotrophomonas sp. NLF4-10]MCG8276531.1 hypothetical protein [Stenotrophomonas sp. NLF4-10]
MNSSKPDHIFIVGVEKGGTTALAGWLVKNGFATYALPGMKEPNHYSNLAPAPPLPVGNLPTLDASVGYFTNRLAMSRLPTRRTRIVVCMRNPFERTWSSYKMKKLVVQQGEGAEHIRSRVHSAAGTNFTEPETTTYQRWKEQNRKHFPHESEFFCDKYFDAEAERIMAGSFLQRTDYETAFLTVRHKFPLLSILWCSYYYRGLRMVLEKYPPEDVTVLTMNQLHDAEKRKALIGRLTGTPQDSSELDFVFTSRDLSFDEPEPDFSTSQFDGLRKLFKYDLEQVVALLDAHGVHTDLLDMQELQRHIA